MPGQKKGQCPPVPKKYFIKTSCWYHLRNLWRFSRLKCKQKSGRVFWCALIKKLCFFISCSINWDKGVATLFWLKWQAQKLIEKVRMIKWCCALSCSLMTYYCLDLIKEKIVTNQMENFDWVPIWKEKISNQFNKWFLITKTEMDGTFYTFNLKIASKFSIYVVLVWFFPKFQCCENCKVLWISEMYLPNLTLF